MQRKNLLINNLNISFLDNEKAGDTLICLHGHFGTASNFAFIEKIFDGRVVIPDLRGHGFSEHAPSYTKKDYLEDFEQLISILNIKNPLIIGHSLGGIIAMLFEAKHQKAKMLIIEDIGTVVNGSNEFISRFPDEFSSVHEVDRTFRQVLKRPLSLYFSESLYYDETSWKFRFDYKGMIISQTNINGTYWSEWEQLTCPVLVMKGGKSWATSKENTEEMLQRNKMAELIFYENAGHGIHDEERDKFCSDLDRFIKQHNT